MSATRLRSVVVLLLAALALSVLAWQFARLRAGSLWPLLLIAPLLAPLRGLLRERRYTYAWSTLLAIGYIVIGLTEVLADPGARLFPALVLFLSCALFIALVAFLRLTRPERR